MVKRTKAKARLGLAPEMRPLAERLLALEEAHRNAIETDDDAFYEDGRHHEMVTLLPMVHQALGIRPWHEDETLIREALGLSPK